MTNKRVVVLGATGHFGGRLCRRLVRSDALTLVVTSRQQAAADDLAMALRKLEPACEIEAAGVDQDADEFGAHLHKLNPAVVVHTAGPYQGRDYHIAEMCIELGCHYVDLADGRAFVNGIDVLNEAALARGVLVVSGASTLPAVSGAVVDELRPRFADIEEIAISIAPAHRTPRGAGTVAAVLSYCGKPFRILRRGRWETVYGWQDLTLQKYPALGRRLSGACDVPDLASLPVRVPGVQSVSFHAALEAPWEQIGLWSMAWLTRLGMISDWSAWAQGFGRLSAQLNTLGSDRGGMQVRLSGRGRDGEPLVCTWDLAAADNHGPEIPCTPAIVLVKRLVRGELTERGARPCTGLASLSEYLDDLSIFSISTTVTTAG